MITAVKDEPISLAIHDSYKSMWVNWGGQVTEHTTGTALSTCDMNLKEMEIPFAKLI